MQSRGQVVITHMAPARRLRIIHPLLVFPYGRRPTEEPNVIVARTPAWIGFLTVALLASAALLLADVPMFSAVGASPLIVGLVLGIFFGHVGRAQLPAGSATGIRFAARTLLRWGIVLYGLRITIQEIVAVGWPGVVVSATIVVTTLVIGAWVGRRWFGLDRETALLTAAGSAVCGAAAVAATEAMLRSAPHKATVAIGTVVCFGTLSMLAYPLLANTGWIEFGRDGWGLLIGGVTHEVAQVVAAGNAMGGSVAETAVVVKMTRVLMLAPALVLIAWLSRAPESPRVAGSTGIMLPWFVAAFLIVVIVNSAGWVPAVWTPVLLQADIIMLTMAMVAMGIETHVSKIRAAGIAPLLHGLFLFVWLGVCGVAVTWVVTRGLVS